MGLANCKECGKVFVQNPSGLCPDCYRIETENEDKVAAFLRDHRRSTIVEVHEATGVPERTILKMIKKGRILGDIEVEYPCENCGRPIHEGRVCSDCSRRVLEQIKADQRSAGKPVESGQVKRSGEAVYTRIDRF